jgi:dTDP-4-amino-4,6-dideoxygalactose transaminase
VMPEAFETPINVTRPFMPPHGDYCRRLEEIWANRWLTNEGPILQRFKASMYDYMGTQRLSLFSNGTLALQIGLQALGITGEVVTTPFTFVATTHALYWNRIRPVFVDIEPDCYTIDPRKVEAAITPFTTAILAVHVYGYPCRLEELAEIARRHNIKLVYDAAHAFGVRIGERTIGDYGDLSMFSFHATKLFHSLEGGMLVFANPTLKSDVDYLKNFGFLDEVNVVMPGTNAKMNEMQALMGEMMLQHVPAIIAERRTIYERYRDVLAQVPGVRFVPSLDDAVQYNYAYVPVQFDCEVFGATRDAVYENLKRYNVYSRRYFYPLICDFACYRNLPIIDPLIVARQVASRILALPIYPGLPLDHVDRICEIVRETPRAA